MTGFMWFFSTSGSPNVELDAPDAEHDRGRNAVILLDAREQRRIFLGDLAAGDDAPVGDAAIEILPELLAEFGLVADFLEPGHVGLASRS